MIIKKGSVNNEDLTPMIIGKPAVNQAEKRSDKNAYSNIIRKPEP
jgi:hypothetical protein